MRTPCALWAHALTVGVLRCLRFMLYARSVCPALRKLASQCSRLVGCQEGAACLGWVHDTTRRRSCWWASGSTTTPSTSSRECYAVNPVLASSRCARILPKRGGGNAMNHVTLDTRSRRPFDPGLSCPICGTSSPWGGLRGARFLAEAPPPPPQRLVVLSSKCCFLSSRVLWCKEPPLVGGFGVEGSASHGHPQCRMASIRMIQGALSRRDMSGQRRLFQRSRVA